MTTTVTASAANQTFERNFAGLTCGTATNTTWALYDYQATLSSPVSLAAGTTYWVSVQAVTPSYDVYWGWRAGTTDNSLSLIRFLGVDDTLTFDRSDALRPRRAASCPDVAERPIPGRSGPRRERFLAPDTLDANAEPPATETPPPAEKARRRRNRKPKRQLSVPASTLAAKAALAAGGKPGDTSRWAPS